MRLTLTLGLSIILAASGLGCSNSDSDGPQPPEILSTLTETLDRYLESEHEETYGGISILVRKDDEVVYRKSFGMADIERAVPVSSETGFRLASVSKMFTAIAIMQLQEQGQLLLDDSIRLYMPELAESWHDIKIRHLLNHRSGIYDYLNDVGANIGFENMTNQIVIDYFVAQPALEFVPDSATDYSSTGFILLAEIIARVSGTSFADYMHTYVFQPANMTGSYIVDDNTAMRAGDALNYGVDDRWFGTYIYTYGGSGQVSSIEDLNRFIVALESGELVSDASFAVMTESYSFFEGYEYGLGFGLNYDGDNLISYGHGGSHDGYRTRLSIDRRINMEMAMLANYGDSSTEVINELRSLIDQFYGL